MSPLLVLAIAIAFIIVGIAVFRLHAFLVLLLAAFLIGIIAAPGEAGSAAGAIELALREFGSAVGKIGFVIALAAVIGMFLLESGAADKIVRRLVAMTGESRAPLALMLGGFILSVPVFFDTVFFLLIPLARALCLRTGKNYLYYVLAICCGGVVTHSLVPPTPGPLATAELLKLDLGVVMVAGLAAGLPVALAALLISRWISGRMPIPIRETRGSTLEELRAVSERPESELPALLPSMLPIVLPVLFIAGDTAVGAWMPDLKGAVRETISFLGNKNVALLIGAIFAALLWISRQPAGKRALGKSLESPLETAGVIILITGAGGAFGAMIKHAGAGAAMQDLAERMGIGTLVLAWGLTFLIRAAQGSATVAMLTSAGLMAGMIGDGSALPYHPLYVFLAIGFGAKSISWMNDSGFWVVGRMSGLTEGETLRSWTLVLFMMSILGLGLVLVMSRLLPFVG